MIDAVNPVLLPGYRLAEIERKKLKLIVSNFLPGVRLVKAFNTLLAAVLASDSDKDGGKRVVFVSSDDVDARLQVKNLIERLGFAVVHLGTLATGAKLQQFPGGPAAWTEPGQARLSGYLLLLSLPFLTLEKF